MAEEAEGFARLYRCQPPIPLSARDAEQQEVAQVRLLP